MQELWRKRAKKNNSAAGDNLQTPEPEEEGEGETREDVSPGRFEVVLLNQHPFSPTLVVLSCGPSTTDHPPEEETCGSGPDLTSQAIEPVDAAEPASATHGEEPVVSAVQTTPGTPPQDPAREATKEIMAQQAVAEAAAAAASATASSSPQEPFADVGEKASAVPADSVVGPATTTTTTAVSPPEPQRLTLEKALDQKRRWSIVLGAHVCFAAGSFVDAMVTSGVGRYLEFNAIDALTVLEPAQEPPSSSSKKGNRASFRDN